jgi:predicted RNase H-like nuclease (RuvC/YqgF family)
MDWIDVLRIVGTNTVVLLIGYFASYFIRRGKSIERTKHAKEQLDDACLEMKNIHEEMLSKFEEMKREFANVRTTWEIKYEQRVQYVDKNFVTKESFDEHRSSTDRRLTAIESLKLGEQLGEIKADIRNLTKSIDLWVERLSK